MPRLRVLSLGYDNLDNLELDTLETLESLSSILQKVPYVYFKKVYERENTEEIQECITRGILKHRSRNTTNS